MSSVSSTVMGRKLHHFNGSLALNRLNLRNKHTTWLMLFWAHLNELDCYIRLFGEKNAHLSPVVLYWQVVSFGIEIRRA